MFVSNKKIMIELPSQTIFHAIEKAIKEYRRFAQRKINEKVGNITVDQTLLLIFLNNHPELSQNEIADLIFKDNASVTRMIELLTKREYLDRRLNNVDRRKYNLEITHSGKKILDSLSNVIASNRKSALNGITKAELEQLNNTLNKIIKNCKKTEK